MATEQKTEVAAPTNDRKRKLEQELEEGLATFKTRQQRFVQLLDAIEQDPEWKWKPDKIDSRKLRLVWCQHQFMEVGDLEVDENGRYTNFKKTLQPTDDVNVALKWLADRIAPYGTAPADNAATSRKRKAVSFAEDEEKKTMLQEFRQLRELDHQPKETTEGPETLEVALEREFKRVRQLEDHRKYIEGWLKNLWDTVRKVDRDHQENEKKLDDLYATIQEMLGVPTWREMKCLSVELSVQAIQDKNASNKEWDALVRKHRLIEQVAKGLKPRNKCKDPVLLKKLEPFIKP